MKKLFIFAAYAILFTCIYQPLIAQSGNVGIGTSDPQAKLHVAGNMQVDNRLVLKDSLNNDRIIIDPDNAFFQMLDTSGNVVFNLSLNSEEENEANGKEAGTTRNMENGTAPTFSWEFDVVNQAMVQKTESGGNATLKKEVFSTSTPDDPGNITTTEYFDENGDLRLIVAEEGSSVLSTYFDEGGVPIGGMEVGENEKGLFVQWKFVDETTNNELIVTADNEGVEVKKPDSGDQLTLDAIGVHSENIVTLAEYFADCFGISKLAPGQFVGLALDLANGTILIEGDLDVLGDISKAGGTFKIDHPQDPTNKWLYHSFVESPDRMNVYNGNVTTNSNGEAMVELPGYFEDLNKDFRYQLTPIGAFAQAIIYKKIENNQFVIKTDKPNVEVSWQVTGIRHDDYAKDNPIIVEAEKTGNERGKLLYDPSRVGPHSSELQNHWKRFDEKRKEQE